MATRRAVLSAIAGLLAVAACGPGEPEGPASSLSFDVRLPPGDVTITSLQLTVLDAAASCDPPDASGGSALLVEPIELGVPKTIQVSAGQRTFSVVAYDGSSAVARGCDRLNLVAGETHTVSIDLVEYPEDIDAGVPDGGAPDAGVPDASTGPEGDDCDTAITLSPGTLYNQLLSADFTDQQSGSCGGDGRDRVYTFTTFTERQVEIETTGNLEHVLYVRAADCSSGAEAGCSVSAGAGTYTASFRQLNLPANTYFVFVDASIAGQTGQFQITLTLSDPVPDICETAEEIALDDTTTGTLVNAGSDYAGNCGGTGPEVVYYFTLTEVSRIRATVTRTSGSFDPVLYLRSDCETPASEPIGGCADDSTGAAEQVDVDYLGAGTHYLFVDSQSGVAGTFELFVEVLPAPPINDRCAGSTSLTEGVTESGTTADGRDDTTGDCTSGSVEVFYDFTLSEPRRVIIDLTNATTEHALYVQGTCGETATELACTSTATADERLEFVDLDAGTYTVVVEAEAGGTGTFDLVYNTYAPVPHDTCAAPIALTDGVPRTGDTTTGAHDDEVASCDGGGDTPDVLYSYTLDEARTVDLSVTTDFDAAVSIRSPSCAEEGDETDCVDSVSDAGTESIHFRRQSPGTYYVLVDGVGGATGTIDEISLTTSAPPPMGDACPEAVLMNHGETLVGQTLASTAYADDNAGSCGGTGNADRVYNFVLSGDQQVTIETANATFDHELYVRSADCSAGAEEDCQQAADVGGGVYEAALSFGSLPAGDYYVWVDAADATVDGTFDITLNVSGVATPPINDVCANASTLVEGLSTSGTLEASTNDELSTCVSGPQGDVFYRITLTEPRRVVVNLTSGTNTALSVLSGACAALTELFCLNDTSAGETLDIGYLATGTYYIMVEGVAGAQGSFNIGYTTSSPRPDNDQCWGAEPLTSGTWLYGESTANGLDDASGSCGGTGSLDVVYEVTVPPGNNQRVRVTVDAASGFDPVLYMRADDCESGTELGCGQRETGPHDTLDLPSLSPGTYYVWVDALSGGSGTFDIMAELLTEVPPPSNDTCTSPDPLVEGAQEGPFSTVGASDDYSLACGTDDSRDTVHSITLDSAAALLVTIIPAAPAWNLIASLRENCTDGPELACVATRFEPRYINLPDLAASTYSVLVDGEYGATGDYTIQYDTRAQDTTFGYWAIESTGTYTPLTGATNIAIPTGSDTGDSWSRQFALPFDFPYFGTTYPAGTELVVTDDMYISFSPYVSGSDSWDNDCLDDTLPDNIIAPFWDDGWAYDANATLSYQLSGEAPERTLTIQWADFDVYYEGTPNSYVLFAGVHHQVVLFENGDIEFRYGPRVDGPYGCPSGCGCDHQGLGCSATIGIEAGTGTAFDSDVVDCLQSNTFDGRVIHFVYPTN